MSICVDDHAPMNIWLSRHFTLGSTLLPVMCGALAVSCLRYGVLDTRRSKNAQMLNVCSLLTKGSVCPLLLVVQGSSTSSWLTVGKCLQLFQRQNLIDRVGLLHRHPDSSSRPDLVSVVQRLSLPDTKLLRWSEEDKATYPEAATLGAGLIKAVDLYKDLQEQHCNKWHYHFRLTECVWCQAVMCWLSV